MSDILNHLAEDKCPITKDSKSSCNDQFSNVEPYKAASDDGSTLATKVFNQIQGAGDGSLVTEHQKSKD